jgi:endonuclease YncB( thermonuclease family)
MMGTRLTILSTSFSILLLVTLGCDRKTLQTTTRELVAITSAVEPSHNSQVVSGRVVGVADGDTVTVLDGENTQHKIRLMGIDAPEKAMPFGQRSKQSLSGLIFGKEVQVEVRAKDRYKREVGRILLDGRDINLAQVQSGMAWVYRQYLKELTQDEAKAYVRAEEEAKGANRGLWSDAEPTPPWEWRRKSKRSRS